MAGLAALGVDLDSVPWKECVLGFSFAVFSWEMYLDLRQHWKLGEKEIPAKVVKALAPHTLAADEFNKSRMYSYDKSAYNMFNKVFSLVQTTLVIALDFLPWAWGLSGSVAARAGMDPDAEISRSIVFAGLLVVISTLVNLPLSIYFTFVIEARHGFNKQTMGLFLSDTAKSLAFTLVIGAPVLAGFLAIIQWAGPNFYFYVWLFVMGFQLVLMVLYPTVIQPLFNKFEPLPEGELKEKIQALARSVQFPLTKLFLVDGSKRSAHSNAYFFGLFNDKRIVLFDTLLEHTTHDEVLAILAHELGHWYHNHIVKRLVVVQAHLFVLFYVFSIVINLTSLYKSFGFASQPIVIGFLLFQFIYSPVDSLMGFVMNLVSRHDEFGADRYAVSRNYEQHLKSGLIKLHLKNSSNLNPDRLYSIWHYSHPALVERLEALQAKRKAD
nr:CAAX prenyl protease 1 [Polyrhizophydium stewartii]